MTTALSVDNSSMGIADDTTTTARATAGGVKALDNVENGNTTMTPSSFLSRTTTTTTVNPAAVAPSLLLSSIATETTTTITTGAETTTPLTRAAVKGPPSPSHNNNKNTTTSIAAAAKKSNETAALEAGQRETRMVHGLRCVVLTLLLLTMCLVSGGIYVYTRNHETQRFETVFSDSAFQVMESFHDALEQSLQSLDTLSVTITSLAKATNQSFPFVTIPDFEVRGATTRIQSGSHILYYFPLVTDEKRDAWEDYAMQHRSHIDVAFRHDTYMRQQQDIALGDIATSSAVNNTSNTNASNSSNNNNQSQVVVATESKNPNITILTDGTGYHPHIWSTGAINPLGDVPRGQGPYLPGWQISPISETKQAILNIDFAQTLVLNGVLDAMLQDPYKAAIGPAVVPIPSTKPLMERNIRASQYRQEVNDFVQDWSTFLVYPIYDHFKNGDDGDHTAIADSNSPTKPVAASTTTTTTSSQPAQKLVGVVATSIYWKFFFSRLLPQGVRGIICVVENSYNQTFSYRIDGPEATFLGAGDLHHTKFDDMEVSEDISSYLRQRSTPRNRAYTTVPLQEKIGQYKIRVYPSDDMRNDYITHGPAVYTVVVLLVFVFTATSFLVFSHVVERRQRIMLQTSLAAAQKAAQDERDLNEFIAHEVRNPLAAAMAASTFVVTTLQQAATGSSIAAVDTQHHQKTHSLRTATAEAKPMEPNVLDVVREDVQVIHTSLHFINDFLRSMLDIQRLQSKELKIYPSLTDILHDVVEPVSAMLYRRDVNFQVIVDCPKNIFVQTDCLRLKQVILNLARNSSKFVECGFIRIKGDVVKGMVQLYVEDSGPGIPRDKRASLFAKFQTSLDRLSQGTGVGLCLSKQLMTALGGDLWLDETYESGIAHCPGARFVVQLNAPPLQAPPASSSEMTPQEATILIQKSTSVNGVGESTHSHEGVFQKNTGNLSSDTLSPPKTVTAVARKSSEQQLIHLPEVMSILFVDDDAILRKLFVRAVRKVGGPTWNIREAASGEMALQLCETETFDLIFLDQYMASIDKQLLGTETARALRNSGVHCKICGLSANDLRDSFLQAGANHFILKPMPCAPDELKRKLHDIINNI